MIGEVRGDNHAGMPEKRQEDSYGALPELEKQIQGWLSK
jgi:hypothetical protein